MADLNIAYTVLGVIEEATAEYYSIEGMGAHFVCAHNFHEGDRVKITIQKVEAHDDRDRLPSEDRSNW